MNRRLTALLLGLTMILAACSGQPASTVATGAVPTASLAEPAAEPTLAPAQVPTLAPTAAIDAGPADPAPTPSASGASPEAASPEGASPTESLPQTGATPGAPASPAQAGATVYTLVPGESQLAYEVGETFFNENNRFAVAKGVTSAVSGTIQVDTANLQNSQLGDLSMDISQFQSDSGIRDRAIRQRFLESSQYPVVTFHPTQVEGLPAGPYTAGQELAFKVTGDLTIRTVTKPATFDVTARLDGDTLSGVAAGEILMSDFGFGPIKTGVLGTEDQVKLTLNFVARPS